MYILTNAVNAPSAFPAANMYSAFRIKSSDEDNCVFDINIVAVREESTFCLVRFCVSELRISASLYVCIWMDG